VIRGVLNLPQSFPGSSASNDEESKNHEKWRQQNQLDGCAASVEFGEFHR
jgi:hypothetical protein